MNEPLCPNCGVNEATSPHTCPYSDELYDRDKDEDEKDLCECCAECEHKCMMDI